MAWAGSFEREAAGIDLQALVHNVLKRNIGGVRSVPGSPANVQAHQRRVNAFQGPVGCIDAQLEPGLEIFDRRFRVDLVPGLRNPAHPIGQSNRRL